MKCILCGKKSRQYICESCVRTNNDPRTLKIWEKNRELAKSLGEAYYKSVLKSYKTDSVKRDSNENLGFNTFCDGINLGLDVTMPFLDDEQLEQARKKARQLIETRKKFKHMGR